VLRYDDAGAAYLITIGAPMARRSAARLVGAPVEPLVQDVEVRVVPEQRRPRVSLYL
jgi:hypothetical protein